jgi:hypothetical protein
MFTALVFTSPDLRFGRGGDDLVFPSAALERVGLALDVIRTQPHIVRGLHSQHFKGADWLQHCPGFGIIGFAWALGAVLLFLIVLSVLAFRCRPAIGRTKIIPAGLASVVSPKFR